MKLNSGITEMLLPANPAAMAANFNLDEFLSVSFTHHMEILNKTATAEERFFYIHQTFIHQWDKYLLRDFLKADLYHHTGQLPNNFEETMPEHTSSQYTLANSIHTCRCWMIS